MPESPSISTPTATKNKHDFKLDDRSGKREHSEETKKSITPSKKGRIEHDEEINFLKDDLHRLKRRVKKTKGQSEEELSKDNLTKIIEYEKNSYQAAKTFLCYLFTKEELTTQLVSGKAPNSTRNVEEFKIISGNHLVYRPTY